MANSNLFLLDFDGTVFNTELIKELLPQFSNSLDIPAESFTSTYESTKNEAGAYDLFFHLKSLNSDLTDEIIEKEFNEFFKEEKLVFPDFIEFVDKVDPVTNDIIIFTLGFDKYQNMKMGLVPDLNEVEKVVLSSDKKDFLGANLKSDDVGIKFKDRIYSTIKFVDDSPKNFHTEEIKGLKQYRILRPGSKYQKIPTPSKIKEVNLLTQLLED